VPCGGGGGWRVVEVGGGGGAGRAGGWGVWGAVVWAVGGVGGAGRLGGGGYHNPPGRELRIISPHSAFGCKDVTSTEVEWICFSATFSQFLFPMN